MITNAAAKKRFILGRLFLRHTLAFYLNRPARDIKFLYNSHGKPYLEGFDNFTFNLSHTADQFAIAVSLSGEVGIDIEQHKPKRNIQCLADEILTIEELQWFNKQPKQQQIPEFYRLWALKEATLKAQGTGMDISMKSFGFEKKLSVNEWNDSLGNSSSWYWHHTHKKNLSIAVALKAYETFNYPKSIDK